MRTSTPAIDSAHDRRRSSASRILLLLTVTYSLNFLDRQILAILAEPIKRDLDLSDTQIGVLTGLAFALFYTTLGVPLAWLADRTNRVRVVALSCALWSAFTALCGMAQNFWQLGMARVGVAIGEAGGTPPSYSIISELFPPTRRALALAIYSLGLPAGVIIGAVAGAFVADVWGWRRAFVVMALPGLVMACVLLLFVREPRGRHEAGKSGADEAPSILAVVRFYFSNPRIVMLSLAGSSATFVGYGILNWMPAFLMRAKGMSLAQIGSRYSWVIGVALGLGTFLGGHIVDRFCERRPGVYAVAPAVAMIFAVPFFFGGLIANSPSLSLGLMAIPAMMVAMYLAPTLALIQNLTPPSMRATSASLLLLILNLIGLGGGPLFVGLISDLLRPSFGDAALVWAMSALTPFLVLTAILYLVLWRLLARASVCGGSHHHC